MLISDLIRETTTAINANRARSALTILGIVIGIGSVIAMISIGQGSSASITEQIEAGGTNIIYVFPGEVRQASKAVQLGQEAESLTNDDAEILENIDHVQAVSPETGSNHLVIAGDNNVGAGVTGVEPEYQDVHNIEMESGFFISSANIRSASRVAVIGSNVAEDLFGENSIPVEKSIRFNNLSFNVIGVMEEKGAAGKTSIDDQILVPITVSQRYLIGSDNLSVIVVKADDVSNMESLEEDMTQVLLAAHNIKNEDNADFQVSSSQDWIEAITEVSGTLTTLLGSIAAISLVVGGIGIMNMMLTSVTERTREIGLRKAIGAKARDINLQFLSESVMLTFFGGVMGIGFGWLVSYLVERFMDTTTVVSIESIVLAFGVSVLIGIVFGYYPARRASKLNPIEALRYE